MTHYSRNGWKIYSLAFNISCRMKAHFLFIRYVDGMISAQRRRRFDVFVDGILSGFDAVVQRSSTAGDGRPGHPLRREVSPDVARPAEHDHPAAAFDPFRHVRHSLFGSLLRALP